jgi:hypothetical protein
MKYAVEMSSGAKIHVYIPSFIKIGSRIRRLIGGGGIHRHTDSMEIAYAYFYFSKYGSVLKTELSRLAHHQLFKNSSALWS